MEMTTAEIVRQYNQAKYKNKKIKILAQLNACDETKIRSILIAEGCIKSEQPPIKVKSGIPDRKLKTAEKVLRLPESVMRAITIRLDGIEEQIRNYNQVKTNAEEKLKQCEHEYRELTEYMKGVKVDE